MEIDQAPELEHITTETTVENVCERLWRGPRAVYRFENDHRRGDATRVQREANEIMNRIDELTGPDSHAELAHYITNPHIRDWLVEQHRTGLSYDDIHMAYGILTRDRDMWRNEAVHMALHPRAAKQPVGSEQQVESEQPRVLANMSADILRMICAYENKNKHRPGS